VLQAGFILGSRVPDRVRGAVVKAVSISPSRLDHTLFDSDLGRVVGDTGNRRHVRLRRIPSDKAYAAFSVARQEGANMGGQLPRLGGALAAICLAALLTAHPALALSAGNGGWQWQNPLPQGGSYASGWFLDEAHGWLVSGADIFHTSNAGATLTRQARHNVSFVDVTFTDAMHGWAVGDPANPNTGTVIIYRTTNGGRLWTRVRLGLIGGISAVSFATARVGWAVSGDAILHTRDGGLHWSVRHVGGGYSFDDVQALGTRRAWVCGWGGLLRTTDGGATWKRLRTGIRDEMTRVQFITSSTGWLSTERGEIFHSTDGGAHWASQLANGAAIGGHSFVDSLNGWATDFGGSVYHTTDGGAHWTQQSSAPSARWRWAFALTQSDAVIGGDGGRLIHTTDAGATWQSGTRVAADFYGDLNALQFIDSATGWAVGSGGEILKTGDGGVDWSSQASGTTQDLNDVTFVHASDGWAAGDQGTVVHTADGGATWTAQTSGVTDDLHGVTFVDAQHGWAVGGTGPDLSLVSSGVILHTDDGGLHWAPQTLPLTMAKFNDIAFADQLHGWAVGEITGDTGTNATVILATKDGGTTWSMQLKYYPPVTGLSSNGVLTSIACNDAGHVVAVGYDDSGTEIFRTINGGAKWTRLVQPVRWGLQLTDVVFIDSTHGWAVGSGTSVTTTDGGATWTRQSVGPNDLPALAVSFVSRTRGWVAGSGGVILTTATGGNAP
jgi:photosystem II stability/assembly factor-like uncharacterized protein